MIVAIDGPAGSGKSTVARAIAQQRGFTYLDTGAMYRSVALAALERGVALDDAEGLEGLARQIGISFGRAADGSQTVAVDGTDVTAQIREPRVDRAVSAVSAVPGVRSVMVALQRRLASAGDVVAEGRDIGTVVFPQAEVKVFLTADDLARARRRTAQNRARAQAVGSDAPEGALDEARVLADIVERDRRDASRAVSPLVAADDAVHIDSSAIAADEVVAQICALIDAARAARGAVPQEEAR